MTCGVTYLKEHVAGKTGNVAACTKATPTQKRICRELLKVNVEKKRLKTDAEKTALEVAMEDIYSKQDDDCVQVGSSESSGEDPDETQEARDLRRAL